MNFQLKVMQMATSKKSAKLTAAASLSKKLRAGGVYRREDLASVSRAVDRNLRELLDKGRLKKLSQGIYYVPRQSAYGPVPPDDRDLVAAFLRDDDFLLLSPVSYNALGLGITQLYNRTLVYNHKRHGRISIGNRTFDFRMKPRFPRKVSAEFLLVDALNNANDLAEEREQLLRGAQAKAREFERVRLKQAAARYGSMSTKKLIETWLHA